MRINGLTGYTIWPLASPLLQFVEKFQSVYHVPDPGALLVTLATYIAFRLPGGNPVWIMIVGGSSSGKTELMHLIAELPLVYPISSMTPAAMLSGTKKKEWAQGASGGLLMEIEAAGGRGMLVFKDFTTILGTTAGHERQLSETSMLGMLRELQDGAYTRRVGTDGSRILTWQGKIGVVAACTTVIDEYRAVMSAMGDRFVFYRMPETGSEHKALMARKARENVRRDLENRAMLKQAAIELITSIPSEWPAEEDSDYAECLDSLSLLVAQCRSQIARDRYTREVEHIHAAEEPCRLSGQFAKLDAGLKLLGVPPARRYQLLRKTAFYSIPDTRLAILRPLAALKPDVPGMTTSALKEVTKLGDLTIRRALEDLEIHGILEHTGLRTQYWWRLTPEWMARWHVSPSGTRISPDTGQVVETVHIH